jgi:PAS domain S-box-containing protein
MDPSDRERLRTVFDAVIDAANAAGFGITVTVDEGDGAKFVYVNPRAAEINGRPEAELIGMPVAIQVAPESLAVARELAEDRRRGTVRTQLVELTIQRPDGTRLPTEIGISYAAFEGRTAAVTFIHDISDRRRATDALRESERRFRQLIEIAPDAISVSRDGVVLYANSAFVSLVGCKSADDLRGQPLVQLVHPDDRPRLRERLALRQGGEQGTVAEYRIVRPDGEIRTVDVVGIGFEFEGAPAVVGFARDVTERNRLHTERIEADRLAAMGTLAAGVGHEINNPLAYVLLNLQAIERELPGLSSSDRVSAIGTMVRKALEGVDRVRSIARDLKAFARSDPDTRNPVDVLRVLESALNIAGHEIRLRARLVTSFEVLPPVLANEARLGQVFLNLLLNAVQALVEGTSPRNEIRVSALPGDADDVVVEVADTGPGVPEALLERIFEPYFTTKPIGVGTGLGLSIARGIVKSFGGTLTASNAPGGGAVFRVWLPALKSYASTAPTAPSMRATPRRMRILIVEDEPTLALALERAIADEHEALVAPGGREALAVLLRDDTFDVVLSDLMMPGMSGPELYREVRARNAHMATRFIFMTGGADTPSIRSFLESAPCPWLEKPFDTGDLKRLLERVASASE